MKTEAPKSERQHLIRELLTTREYSNQHDVVRAMRKHGMTVTQASISRDFRELGVVKVGGAYRTLETSVSGPDPILERTARGVLVSIEQAGPNLLVVKTHGGAAGIIAASLDKRRLNGVLGTIAGDDTVFVATVNQAAQKRAKKIVEQLNSEWSA